MNPFATTFYELFADNLARRGDKTFIVDPASAFSYAEVAAEVDRVATFLRACGIGAGNRVVVQVRKSMREVAAMLAVAKVGGTMVNVSTAWTCEQLRFVAEDSEASAMIVEPRMAQTLGSFCEGYVTLVNGKAPSPSEATSWSELTEGEDVPAAPVLDGDLAAIIYTSGSTGKPKGVMLSHANILGGARSVGRYLGLDTEDRLLSVLPYSFDYGLNQLTTMMLVGGTVVHQPLSLPAEIVRSINDHGVTGFAAVPPLWIQLARLLKDAPTPFPTLRYITNSGGKIPSSILDAMPAAFPGTQIFLMYGLTEAFRSTFLAPDRFEAKRGSIGRAIPGAEIYIVKADGSLAGPGEQGELVHRGPLVSQGYWKRPDATAEKIRPCPALGPGIGDEPVVYSGDTVRIDEDGDLWFVGRTDGLIKSSGFRISPEDVEDLVHASGMVADAVAFGIDDPLLGQCVHIAVTMLGAGTEDDLMAHCRRVMPGYMVPKAIHLWPQAMPRTASGKLARPEVVRSCSGAPAQPQA